MKSGRPGTKGPPQCGLPTASEWRRTVAQLPACLPTHRHPIHLSRHPCIQRTKHARAPASQPPSPPTLSNREVMTAVRSFLGATATRAGACPASSPSAAPNRAAAAADAAASNQQKCRGCSARPSAAARSTSSCCCWVAGSADRAATMQTPPWDRQLASHDSWSVTCRYSGTAVQRSAVRHGGSPCM